MTQSVLESLNKQDILKDIFPTYLSNYSPKGSLLIDYPTPSNTVSQGNTLPTGTTQDEPSYYYKADVPIDTHDKFTLIFTDPDAPSRTDKKFSEFCHQVVTDISFESKDGGAIITSDNTVVLGYIGPGPPKNTGLHRYVFALYRQNPDVKEFTEIKDRYHWGYGVPAAGINNWATENKLELLTINFYLCQNDVN